MIELCINIARRSFGLRAHSLVMSIELEAGV